MLNLIFVLGTLIATDVQLPCLPNADLTRELTALGEADQEPRLRLQKEKIKFGTPEWKTFWEKYEPIDRAHMARLAKIIDQYGWPGKCLVGDKAATSAFLILQHADDGLQKTYLPTLQNAVDAGQADPSDLAYLTDRVLMRDGKPQKYGSQTQMNEKTGKYELYPVEDVAHVDERRAAVGLGTLRDYLVNDMGIEYTPPKSQ
jgi:hypothetical protein